MLDTRRRVAPETPILCTACHQRGHQAQLVCRRSKPDRLIETSCTQQTTIDQIDIQIGQPTGLVDQFTHSAMDACKTAANAEQVKPTGDEQLAELARLLADELMQEVLGALGSTGSAGTDQSRAQAAAGGEL